MVANYGNRRIHQSYAQCERHLNLGVAKPDSDTLARLYGLVGGYPEVIGTQLPVIRAQLSLLS